MKNNNMAAAVLAAITAVSGLGLYPAYAADNGIDFDGKGSAAIISVTEVKAGLAEFQGPVAAAAPAQSATRSEIKIKAIIKGAGKTKEETLTCSSGLGADRIADCKKSDLTPLAHQELNTLALRRYFSAETLKFADLLNQNKHSYTNQSGPMTFECDDACGNYDLVSIGFSLTPPYLESFEMKCVEWTHECDCVAGC